MSNLEKTSRNRFIRTTALLLIPILIASPAFALTWTAPKTNPNIVSVRPLVNIVDPSFSSSSPKGGIPFCFSGSLGTILCYGPSYLKNAYDFPGANGALAANGSAIVPDGFGTTIVIVDAFGSPTIQSDLNTFDTTFGLPAATVTVLCAPTWTGATSDKCPLNTIGDITTVGGTPAGIACGGVPGVTGWAEETTLDVTMVHGLAPHAHIVLVVADDCFDASINNAESAVVSRPSLAGSVMSQSFGGPDDQIDPATQAVTDGIFATATANHWTILASSGDSGANTDAFVNGTLELTPSWPASSPLVLAVGGTQGSPYGGQYGPPPGPGGVQSCPPHSKCNTGLDIIKTGRFGCQTATRPGLPSDCAPLKYGGEATWNEFNVFGPGTATGGGVSVLYPVPSYQSKLPSSFKTLNGVTVHSSGRLNPDVSFNSAIDGGYLVFLGFLGTNGLWGVFGGTSAASPAWAAIIALLNQEIGGHVGFVNPAIYALAQSPYYHLSFHDITKGNNAICQGQCGEDGFLAKKGYDLTTGWGTPDVEHFLYNILQFLP